jgi:hypothetical protein
MKDVTELNKTIAIYMGYVSNSDYPDLYCKHFLVYSINIDLLYHKNFELVSEVLTKIEQYEGFCTMVSNDPINKLSSCIIYSRTGTEYTGVGKNRTQAIHRAIYKAIIGENLKPITDRFSKYKED